MKKIIKLITVVLALIMILSTFAGCGSKPKKPAGSTGAEEIVGEVSGAIVENGESNYKIVIGMNYSETELFAATEMQNFIFDATGVKLPISLDTGLVLNEESQFVSIGNTSLIFDVDTDVNYDAMNIDGFILRTKHKSIFINGACDRGTLYGVYDFLERFVGVKFLTDDYTYVPTLEKIDFREISITEIPAFPLRIYLTNPVYNDALFLARMRMSGVEHVNAEKQYGGKEILNGFCHNTLVFVPTSEYFNTAENKAANAHMYNSVLKDGAAQDICFTDGIADDGGIDESLPVSAFKVALKTLKERVLNSSEGTTFFFFSMMDTTDNCQCSRCLTRTAKYYRSGNVVRFTNLLAKEINKWSQEEFDGRKINLIMFAYNDTLDAPVANGKPLDPTCIPNEYVHVRIAPIQQNQYYSVYEEKNDRIGKAINGWSSICENIMIWNYHTYYTNFCWYFPTRRAWKTDLTTYEKIGTTYILMQSDYKNADNWQDKLNCYIASKMMWDTSVSVHELEKEFIEYYYGIASDAVKEVMGRLDEKIYEISLTNDVVFGLYEISVMDAKHYSIDFLNGLCKILDDKIEEVLSSNDPRKEQIALALKEVKLTPLFMIVQNVKAYYADSEQIYNTVSEFVNLASETGLQFLSEGGRVDALRTQYGIK